MKFVVSVFAALGCAVPAVADDVTLRFIANEGVHITDGHNGVLIDALTWNSYDGRFALPSEENRAAMINGAAPFDAVDALLFTHIHGDHSDPDGAAEILNAQSDIHVAASVQVVDAILNGETPLLAGRADRLIPVALTAEGPGPIVLDGHDNIQAGWVYHTEGIDNITWRVEIGGVSILHLGDTQPQMADFSVWDGIDFDVILYPYWFVQMEEGVAFLDSRPDSRAIAFHLPATAEPQSIRAALGEREYVFVEGETIVIEAHD